MAQGPGQPGPCSTWDGPGIVVGMSGGVDSSVAALLLKRAGYRVVGVTLRLWDPPGVGGERSCCSSEAVLRAKAVADALGIPHLTVDARDIFASRVVEYFVNEHALGRTPNPCVKCNARVRFSFMLDLVARLGMDEVATGHYARLTAQPAGLARGADLAKDQSYVLAEVPPELLRRLVFPLGELRKPQVRALATEAGLAGASQPESQEICFVPDDDHRGFLRTRLGERPGSIVDMEGKEVGHHQGTYNFTVGQRRGLRIGGGEPAYVMAVDAEKRRVVVGERSALAVGALRLGDVVRHRQPAGGEMTVQVRSSGGVVPARMPADDLVVLGKPALGVAPGQTAVVYEGENVIAAGTILETTTWETCFPPQKGQEKCPMV